MEAPLNLLLLYPLELRNGDGTTVQLRRLLAGKDRIWHVYGVPGSKFDAIPDNVISIPVRIDPWYPFFKGARTMRQLWRRWVVGCLALRKLKRKQRSLGAVPPQSAYVVLLDDANAAHARSTLMATGISQYTLHLMDLFHTRFDPKQQPQLHALLAGATRVLTVSKRLADEIRPSCRVEVEVFPLASGCPSDLTVKPDLDRPTVIMSGALYSAHPHKVLFFTEVLLPAWRQLQLELPQARWIYTGADGDYVKEVAGDSIEVLGLLEERAWAEILGSCCLGILPVIHSPDDHYKYSVPSRIVDYFYAGVPVLAPQTAGTATADFMRDHEGRGALCVSTKEEAYQAMKEMLTQPEVRARHAAGLQNCRGQFSGEAVRQALKTRLLQANNSPA